MLTDWIGFSGIWTEAEGEGGRRNKPAGTDPTGPHGKPLGQQEKASGPQAP